METLSFQAPTEMKLQLEHFATELDRSKAYLIRQALEEYLMDLEDYMEAKNYKARYNPSDNISLDALKQKYDLN